jgi:hypothetical protein
MADLIYIIHLEICEVIYMKILIDADGCPVVGIAVEEGKKRGLEIILICDTSHYFNIEGVESLVVDKGADSADFVLVNRVSEGDVVVTQDYGLAAMVLAKKGRCINQNGLIYNAENIDNLLFRRHIGKKIRRAGGRTTHIKKRTAENDESFRKSLVRLLDGVI